MKDENLYRFEDVSEEEIYAAYNIAAKVLATYGDRYLPIFSRLHLEIGKVDEKKNLKMLAQNITKR